MGRRAVEGFANEYARLLSRGEFVETFLPASPGRGFELYSETRFRRAR